MRSGELVTFRWCSSEYVRVCICVIGKYAYYTCMSVWIALCSKLLMRTKYIFRRLVGTTHVAAYTWISFIKCYSQAHWRVCLTFVFCSLARSLALVASFNAHAHERALCQVGTLHGWSNGTAGLRQSCNVRRSTLRNCVDDDGAEGDMMMTMSRTQNVLSIFVSFYAVCEIICKLRIHLYETIYLYLFNRIICV